MQMTKATTSATNLYQYRLKIVAGNCPLLVTAAKDGETLQHED